MTWLPDEDLLIATQIRSIELYGGLPGLKSRHALESACRAPHRSAFGEFVFRSVEEKACALMFELATQHPFHDGNKRVAIRALLMTLRKNGRLLLASEEELFQITSGVANSQSVTLDGLIAWVVDRVRPAP